MAVGTYTKMGKIKLDALNEQTKDSGVEIESDDDFEGFPFEPDSSGFSIRG